MRPLLATSLDSLGMEIVVLSNAEGNKITVAGAGGVQLKIFPRVLANKARRILL